ncbi:restriction endonuclease subunit S [Microbulbifer sp.]|uniref:restriction endonuclease subunit S n=1 Tax=Microbulbifer sp. TaxID=1908541 RepID=UPI003F3BAD8A
MAQSDQVAEASAKYLVDLQKVQRAESACPPGYKQTEVGVIPEDWEVRTVGSFSPFVTSGSRGWAEYYADFGNPFIRITNLSRESIYLDLRDTKYVALPKESAEGKRTQLLDGDILISITADIGIIGYVNEEIEKPAYINQHIAMVRFGRNEVDTKFLSYYLASESVQKLFRGATDQGAKAGMNLDGVRAIKFSSPPLCEQRHIASALSDTDALIESLEKLIAKKQAIKAATMQQLLTGKTRLPQFAKRPDGTPKGTKQSELGEIPEDWRAVSLASIGSFSKGSGISRAEANSGEIPCVRYGELYTKHNDVIREYSSFISRSVALSAQKLQQGDILFAGSGETKEEIGKAAAFLDEFEAYAGGDIVILSPRNCDPVYLGYCLNSPYVSVQKASRGQGDAVVHISASALSSVAIMLPGSLEEQVAISTVVSEMDHEIHTLQQRLAKTRQIKQGMMQQLLTGKTRLVQPEEATA